MFTFIALTCSCKPVGGIAGQKPKPLEHLSLSTNPRARTECNNLSAADLEEGQTQTPRAAYAQPLQPKTTSIVYRSTCRPKGPDKPGHMMVFGVIIAYRTRRRVAKPRDVRNSNVCICCCSHDDLQDSNLWRAKIRVFLGKKKDPGIGTIQNGAWVWSLPLSQLTIKDENYLPETEITTGNQSMTPVSPC